MEQRCVLGERKRRVSIEGIKARKGRKGEYGFRLTLGVVLEVLDEDMLDRGGLKGKDKAVADELCGQGQSLLGQALDPLELIALRPGLDIGISDIEHEESGFEVGDDLATRGGLLSAHATQPKVEDRCQGQHRHGWVGLATLDERLLALAKQCDDVGDQRGGNGRNLCRHLLDLWLLL